MTLNWVVTLTVLVGSTVLIYASLYIARIQPEQKTLALITAKLGLSFFFLSGATASARLLEPGVVLTIVQGVAVTSSLILLGDCAFRLFNVFRRRRGTPASG